MKKPAKTILFIALPLVLSLLLVSFFLYPYLDYTKPLDSKVLVIEGWISEAGLSAAADMFMKGPYERIITVGVPTDDPYSNPGKMSGAEIAYRYLIKKGIPKDRITAVPAPEVKEHNTLVGALFLKHWLKENDSALRSFILVTETVHSRKSYIIFKRVLPDIEIGARPVPTQLYWNKPDIITRNNWYTTIKGIYFVIKYSAGCVYAHFVDIAGVERRFFH